MGYLLGAQTVRYPSPMPDDDVLSRYVEAGLALLAIAQAKAETALKDVSSSGEAAVGQAQKAAEWLTERGRKGTEELLELLRREIRGQVEALGLATKEDISRLEARLAPVEKD